MNPPVTLWSRLPALVAALAACCALALAPAGGSAATGDPVVVDDPGAQPAPDTDITSATTPPGIPLGGIPGSDDQATCPDRVQVSTVENFDESGFIVSPDVTEISMNPGEQRVQCLKIANRTRNTILVELQPIDSQPSDDPNSFVDFLDGTKYGLASWLDPLTDEVSLQPGDVVDVPYVITVPEAPPVGTNLGAVFVKIVDDGSAGGGNVNITPQLASQVLVEIPGELSRQVDVLSFSSDTLIQHGSYSAFEFTLRNQGNTTAHLRGALSLESSLGGKSVKTFRFENERMLRDSKRDFRQLWTDPPWIGRFTPVLRFEYEGGQTIEERYPAVWVIPPWEYLLGVLVALLIPIAIMVWRRWRDDDWQQYLDDEDDELAAYEDVDYSY